MFMKDALMRGGPGRGEIPAAAQDLAPAPADKASLTGQEDSGGRPHLPAWLDELTYKDWLFDGYPIRGDRMLDRFAHLDWNRAWVDLGPSVAGNPGPYWHVPLHYEDDDTVHRLYPKVLTTKWLLLIRRACEEVAAKCDSDRLQAENLRLQVDLASARIRIAELERASLPSGSRGRG